jgi:hypothetical protein
MTPFLGIVVAPLVFLTSLSAVYALAPWACATQRHGWLNLVPAAALIVVVVALALSWRELRAAPGPEIESKRQRFLACVSLGESALFTVAVVAQWLVQASLSPCIF